MAFRVAHGFDIHPLVRGRRLVLAGIRVPADAGCAGHSDADVVLHAIADALLGAVGLADLGERFPDTVAAYKDADSTSLLREVLAAVSRRGGRPVNVDVTLYLERPKLGDLKEKMRSRLAEIIRLDPSSIGFKARTFEGFGAIGEGRAVAATAVVLVEVENA